MKKLSIAILIFSISSFSYSAESIIAHRGVHHTYSDVGLERETCTASRIYPPTHELFENTIPSMHAAFNAGADWVELDVYLTSDEHFVVFHDWTLDCRTNGKGVTRKHTLEYLKSLDIGFGYTADNGASFPLRGKGIGLMPTLTEVLAEFPEKAFLINMKSGDLNEARSLASFLNKLSAERKEKLMVYGGKEVMLEHVATESGVMVWPARSTIMQCYETLIASEGTSLGACAGRIFGGPLVMAEKIPGWPQAFIDSVNASGGMFYVMDINSPEDWQKLGPNFKGGIWTDSIEIVGPLINNRP